MKRRNADPGKLRRPIKRTKITEGMYGNSMLYLKFIIVWASVMLADYMLEFRFEFLWPFWILLRSFYDTYRYQGLAFSVFFICVALTSDMICFFFIPIQFLFFAASTYVWVQFVWYTFADKGICLPTVVICCFIVYVEGVRGGLGGGVELGWGARPLAAHCIGFPAVTLGVGVKKYVVRRLRARTQKLVKAQNEFYLELMREALPSIEATAVCACPTECAARAGVTGPAGVTAPAGASTPAGVPAPSGKRRAKQEHNGQCFTDKSEQIDASTDRSTRERDKHQYSGPSNLGEHAYSNGAPPGPAPPDEEERSTHSHKGGGKSKCDKKEANTLKEEKKEEKRKNKKDKDKDKDKETSDSHKSTENTKEQTIKDKEVESTKDNVKSKESLSSKEKEKEKEKEAREREREREKEREREREKELREAQENLEELKRIRGELAAARNSEAEAKKALTAALAADKLRKADYNQLKQAHATLQHKVSAWRAGAGAAMERKLSEERRARQQAELLLKQGRNHTNECTSGACVARRSAHEAEASALRRELQRAREHAQLAQRDTSLAEHQMRALEARVEASSAAGSASEGGSATWGALTARAAQLERALSSETRVKLDLLAALGEANRKMQIQDSLINRQEKEIEELKVQMLAVMPTDFISPVSTSLSKQRNSDGSSNSLRHCDGSSNSFRHCDGSSNSLRHCDGSSNSLRHCDGSSNSLRQSDGLLNSLRHSDGASNSLRHSDGLSNSFRHNDGLSNSLRQSDGSTNFLRQNDGLSNSLRQHDGLSNSLRQNDVLSNSLRQNDGFSNSLRQNDGFSNSLRQNDGLSNSLRQNDCLSNSLRQNDCLSNSLRQNDCLSNSLRQNDGFSNSLRQNNGFSNSLRHNDGLSNSYRFSDSSSGSSLRLSDSSSLSSLRLSDGSPLDPNATVYSPKQLCSDA